jgi:hypothetical protein
MLADEVIIPAASFIESELCARILAEFSPDVFGTQIVLTGGGSSLEEFIEDKRLQYHPEQAQGRAYRSAEINAPFPWRPRVGIVPSEFKEAERATKTLPLKVKVTSDAEWSFVISGHAQPTTFSCRRISSLSVN